MNTSTQSRSTWRKRILIVLVLTVGIGLVGAGLYVRSKQVQRQGELSLNGLQDKVRVDFDERGVPHIYAQQQTDAYRALGYLHAQDRLFQMEMARRLAKGQLAEILGPKLLDTDKLFRSLQIAGKASQMAAQLQADKPEVQALYAYLDGINQFLEQGATPLEFDLLRIPKRRFDASDSFAVAGYLAYSFSAALRTDPVMTYVRDQLGSDYLKVFDLSGSSANQLSTGASALPLPSLSQGLALQQVQQLAALSQQAQQLANLPEFEGSNAWIVSGKLTQNGKPLLAGDPHIGFANPAVWYEAHLHTPDFELYGYHQALFPFALLGHNQQFAWSLTMLQNDDMDLVAEQINPAAPNQVKTAQGWQALQTEAQTIAVKGQPARTIWLRRSSHGPIISDAIAPQLGSSERVLALSWTFLESDNPLLSAFYQLNRASQMSQAKQAASQIHSPGLNILWANQAGDMAWYGAARLRQRAAELHGHFIMDGQAFDRQPVQLLNFSNEHNPVFENPANGLLVSANQRPPASANLVWQGYFNLPYRAQRLEKLLQQKSSGWNTVEMHQLQLDQHSEESLTLLRTLLGIIKPEQFSPEQQTILHELQQWQGDYGLTTSAPSVLQQWLYQIIVAAFSDELGEVQLKNFLRTRQLDFALPRLINDAQSPWWDNRQTTIIESREIIVTEALRQALAHLQSLAGKDYRDWQWGKLHTLTHKHPFGQSWPMDALLNVGPYAMPGNRELINNQAIHHGTAPWAINYGPSTRRVIDLAKPEQALGGIPTGQSGVRFDAHYQDQATAFAQGQAQPQYLSEAQVQAKRRSTLVFVTSAATRQGGSKP